MSQLSESVPLLITEDVAGYAQLQEFLDRYDDGQTHVIHYREGNFASDTFRRDGANVAIILNEFGEGATSTSLTWGISMTISDHQIRVSVVIGGYDSAKREKARRELDAAKLMEILQRVIDFFEPKQN